MKKTLGLPLFLGLAGLQLVAVLVIVFSSYVSSERVLIFHARNLLHNVGLNTMEHSRGFLKPAHDSAELAVRLARNRIVASDDPMLVEQLLFQQLQLAGQASGMYLAREDGSFVFVMRDHGQARTTAPQDEGDTTAAPSSDGTQPPVFRTKLITLDGDGNRHTRLIWRDAQFRILRQQDDPTDSYDPRQRPWYRDAAAAGTTVWADPYIFFSSRQPGITLAAPVVLPGGGVAGVIGVDIEISEISDFLSRLQIGRTGRALIINRNGDVIAGQRPDLLQTTARDGSLRFLRIDEYGDPIARAAFAPLFAPGGAGPDAQTDSSFTHDGRRYVSLAMPILSEALPWTIGVYAPEDDFIAEIKQNRVMNLWIAVVAAVATGLIGLVLARAIYRPIRAFAIRSALISQGEIDPEEPAPRTYRELDAANTALTQQLAARRRAENEYGRTFEMSSRGMAQLDPVTGRFLKVNARLCDIIGLPAELLTQRSLRELVLPADRTAVQLLGREQIADFSTDRDLRIRRADGTIAWVRLNAIMIRDNDGRPLHSVLTVEDVTEAHDKESEIDALNREMSALARDNTMGQLASGLAHELNQPLAAIAQNAGTALYMLQSSGADGELIETLQEVEEQALRAGEIINALRGLVHKDESKIQPFDLCELIEKVQRLVLHEAEDAGVLLRTDCPGDTWLLGNRVQIAQVLVNLLRNAIEALAMARSNNRVIVVSAIRLQGDWLVTVSDNGPGVDSSISLFTQFQTTKPDGLGLGLSICQSIVRANGGKLWYEPGPEGGARFLMMLPSAEAPEGSPAAGGGPAPLWAARMGRRDGKGRT